MTINLKTLRRTAFATALASAVLMAFPMTAVADQAAGSQDEPVEAARNPAVPNADFDFIVPRTEANIRSEEHTSELKSRGHPVCSLLLENKKTRIVCRY